MSDSDVEMYEDSGSDFSDGGGDTPPSTSRSETTPKSLPKPKNGQNASTQYQKLTQLEHILKRPDTYIGSVEKTGIEMWTFDASTESMVFKEVHIVPGLYKIFDEILVNAADNKIRDPSMRNIKVKIDPETNMILVMNDGKGIPVEIHDKEKIYIPELIFGNLLTSSNYDDDEKKVTGGRNGYGAKLCNIFSSQFELETADLNTEQVYRQIWSDNMSKVTKPKITKLKSKKEYTKVTFKPDLSKFGMESLDGEILSVLRRRVYDLCGTVKDCNIYLNDKKLNIKNFKNYVEMYVNAIKERSPEPTSLEPKNYTTIVHEVVNSRWEVAFAVSDGTFNQVSFVNSIATTSGGTHVKFVSDQIVNKLIETLSKKEKGKKKLMIKPQEVRNNMFLFLNCLVENPAFTSQTKEQLTTRVAQFGGKASEKLVISDQFIAKILKTSIVDKIRDIATANEDKALQKVDGSRKLRIKNQSKLVDANKAGTKDGYKCTLILTEGDSAKSLAVSGMAVVGRDYYGCFPLRGKLLNVREASADQIAKNSEINALKQIIGLQHKKHYDATNIKNLRYGHLMIMTDQDQDGSHIKGLIINFLETSFPGLLSVPGFLLEFITPIVKITIKQRGRNNRVIPFYNMPEFEQWRATEGTRHRWTHKYYKGLGTSTGAEAREYFAALDRHLKTFHVLQDEDKLFIDLAFSKKKADDRKEWLQGFLPGTHLDPTLSEIPISDFINKELILFSMADNIRSIPSVLDGFKPGQRKVLFGCFKRNLRSEVKVAQLAGYIGENTGYHHGEVSLIQTIIGLAQNFVGSNNLNILKPNGSFGTRAAGGKDYSAARYIFTEINEITRKVFNPLDNSLYTYVQDDESTVEPEWYLPVLPMILVNGAEGIGTGWSTNIPCFNPVDIVDNIRKMMAGEELEEMTPWYRGWDGELERAGSDKYKVLGRINKLDDTSLEITEIPVKTWTDNVKEFLMSCLGSEKTPAWIKDVEEHHGVNVNFWVKMSPEEMTKTEKIGFLERFKLISSISMSNMVAFDPLGRIKKYSSPLDILRDYYYVRLEYYQKRKDFMMEDLQNQLIKLSEQARFIKMIIDKKLTISNRKRSELVQTLLEHNFAMFTSDNKQVKKSPEPSLFLEAEQQIEEEEEEIGDISQLNVPGSAGSVAEEGEHKPESLYSMYDYLLGMAIWSLTRERYEKLLKQRDDKEDELNTLLGKSAKDLWNEDLDDFLIEWEKFLERDLQERSNLIVGKSTKKKARKQVVKKETKRKVEDPTPEVSTKKVKKEMSSEPSMQKNITGESTPAKSTSTSTTPELKQEPSVLSFFSKASEPKEKPTTGTKTKPVSLFSESEDDDILGSIKPVKAKSESTSKLKPKAGSKEALEEELRDLQDPLPKATGPRRRNEKPKVSYKVVSSESEDESMDFDDDDDESEEYNDDD